MADFEVATGAIFTGGVSHCVPTVQDGGQALAECMQCLRWYNNIRFISSATTNNYIFDILLAHVLGDQRGASKLLTLSTNRPKNQRSLTYNGAEEQQILTFQKLKPENVWPFYFTDLNKQLIIDF